MSTAPGLQDWELEQMRTVFKRNGLATAILFGSRAMGTHRPASDVDVAIRLFPNNSSAQNFDELRVKVQSELDSLTLPYTFDVVSLNHSIPQPLLDHIHRVGIVIYGSQPDPSLSDPPSR